jgi:hypothetical protein
MRLCTSFCTPSRGCSCSVVIPAIYAVARPDQGMYCVGVTMPAGWYPYPPAVRKPGTWAWPSKALRRYWDGAHWQGPVIRNTDVEAVGPCPGCEHYTALLKLKGGDHSRDLSKTLAISVLYGFHPKNTASVFKALLSDMTVVHLRCVDCRQLVSICPSCMTVHRAEFGLTKCQECGKEYIE